ncbi:MAG: hypothetical protein QW683_08945 [Candidatus Caldarchaeum sp.]
MQMKQTRRLLYLVLASLAILIAWWLIVRTPHPQATIGHFGNHKFLCVKPGQLLRLTFSKPLPSGVDEVRKEMYRKSPGAVFYINPEYAAELQYWGSLGVLGEWQIVSEKEIIVQIPPDGLYGPVEIEYPSPKNNSAGQFKLMLFIEGDPDVDRILQFRESLPADGKVPSEGDVSVYYKEPSLLDRLRFWLYIAWKQYW